MEYLMNVLLVWFILMSFHTLLKQICLKSKTLTKINVCWQTHCRQEAYPLPPSDSVRLALIPQALYKQ